MRRRRTWSPASRPCPGRALRTRAMPKVLPPEFEASHVFAFQLHDMLAEYVVVGEQAGAQYFEHKLKSPEHVRESEALQGEELWAWMEANGYRDALEEYSYRHTL